MKTCKQLLDSAFIIGMVPREVYNGDLEGMSGLAGIANLDGMEPGWQIPLQNAPAEEYFMMNLLLSS